MKIFYKIFLFIWINASLVEASAGIENNDGNTSASEKSHKILRPISLEAALVSTIYKQLEIKIAEMGVYRQKGLIQSTAGPFDPVFNGIFDELVVDDEQFIPFGVKSNLGSTLFENQMNVVKKTRIGTVLTTSSNMSRVHDRLLFDLGQLPNSRLSLADVVVRVDQALLRGGLGEGIEFQKEKAAQLGLEAVEYDVLQTIALKVRDTALAYWSFIQAIKSLKINQDAERVFESLMVKIERLIEAKETAAGDILQVKASLAIKKRNTIAAEFNLYLTMKELLFAMGEMEENLLWDDCDFDHVVEALPEYLVIPSNINSLAFLTNKLVDHALSESFDVRASLIREGVASLILEGLGNDLLPELNVFGQVRTSDFKTGDDANHMYSALYFRHPQYDWKVGVSLSIPFANDAAEGAYKQGAAVLDQVILRTEFLKEQLIRDVLATVKNQVDLAAQVSEANKAVMYYQKVVANQFEKMSAGFTTLFELISYENSLIDTLLIQNNLYADYARNIANLRFFSATLLRTEDRCRVSFEDLMQPPFLAPIQKG